MQDLINEIEKTNPDKASDYVAKCKPDSALSPEQLRVIKKHRLLNVCVLVFTFILTAIAMLTFFVAVSGVFTGTYSVTNAYYIASTYVLCMLLAAPTLKVFLDKCTCIRIKRLNIAALIAVFAAILILVVVISLTFAFPQMFA